MENYLLISDAAKEVKVESHVLRYWEDELHLPIKRNELGHRYYTKEDVERFKQIKGMKERGLQLKAIKMILKDGKLDVLSTEDLGETEAGSGNREPGRISVDVIPNKKIQPEVSQESREDKARRLQWLLQQLVRQTLKENNRELCQEIRESVVKELDYQFRMQEEREENRDRVLAEREEKRDQMMAERDEEYFKKMDELLRKKARHFGQDREEKLQEKEKREAEKQRLKEEKKKAEKLEKLEAEKRKAEKREARRRKKGKQESEKEGE